MSNHRPARFRPRYGEGPLHLLLLAASFAVTGYAGLRLLNGDWFAVALWFVGSALVHDLVVLPLYALADRALRSLPGVRGREWMNFVRVPAALSGLLLLVWFPLITRRVEHYERGTGLPADVFLSRWLVVTALLFTGSALWLLARLYRRRRRAGPKNRTAGSTPQRRS